MKPVYDGASGVLLDPRLVREARADELRYVHQHKVWVEVPRSQARARGKRAVGTKWVDVNRGDALAPGYRSRRVAKALRAFAPWPPHGCHPRPAGSCHPSQHRLQAPHPGRVRARHTCVSRPPGRPANATGRPIAHIPPSAACASSSCRHTSKSRATTSPAASSRGPAGSSPPVANRLSGPVARSSAARRRSSCSFLLRRSCAL